MPSRSAAGDPLPCASCPVRDLAICRELLDYVPDDGRAPAAVFDSAEARADIYRDGEFSEHAYILCSGWAFRFVILPTGSRQILDFVLPGEVFPPAMPFRRYASSSAKALTDVAFRRLGRQDLERFLAAVPQALQRHAQQCAVEFDRLEGLLADLGRRTATERVARLFLAIMRRLEIRGRVRGNAFEFPLRQQHIADALGLTQVHVNRTLRGLREADLIRFDRGQLHVNDVVALQRIAGLAA